MVTLPSFFCLSQAYFYGVSHSNFITLSTVGLTLGIYEKGCTALNDMTQMRRQRQRENSQFRKRLDFLPSILYFL